MNIFAQKIARILTVWFFFGFCLALCSCERKGLLPNEKPGKLELSTFILNQIAKYGGSNIPTARRTTSGITNYVYAEDKDGFQVLCLGNKVAALRSVFQPHFGNPVMSATNANGLSSFVYTINQTGVAVNCGLDSTTVKGTRQEVTQLVILRPEALK